MNKRTNDPEGLRRRLLDVAASLFQAHGYHATSMHDLMREAGVTGGALHHHFPSKKALGLAVIRERVAQAVTETWIEPVQAARNGEAGLQAVFDDICSGLEARGRVQGCPVNNLALELSMADADFRAAINEIFHNWRQGLAFKLQADGSRKADAETRAAFVIAAYSGAMAMAKAEQSSAPLRLCARELFAKKPPSPPDKRRAAAAR